MLLKWQKMQKTAALATLLILVSAPLTVLADPGHESPGSEPGDAYLETVHFENGFIACAFSYAMVLAKDHCADHDPNAKNRFSFPMDAGLTGLVVTLESTGRNSIDTDPALKMKWSNPPSLGEAQYEVAGEPPVTRTFDLSNDTWQEDQLPTPEDMPATFEVRLDNPGLADGPAAAYQYGFAVHLGLFYNGEPIPDGYDPATDTVDEDDDDHDHDHGDTGSENNTTDDHYGHHHSATPSNETFRHAGFIACAASYGPINTKDLCDDHDPNAQYRFSLHMRTNLTGIAIHLDADGDALHQQHGLSLRWYNPPSLGVPEYHMSGTPPLYQTFDVSEEDWRDTQLPTQAGYDVRLQETEYDNAPAVAYQYPFDVCIGLFYDGEPIPEDFVETSC